jgi:hypothetical protein
MGITVPTVPSHDRLRAFLPRVVTPPALNVSKGCERRRRFYMEAVLIQPLFIGGVAILLYVAAGAIYRLYLSPIAKFPGPKLTALTLWYEFYYDVIRKGKFHWRIKEMHEKYGESFLVCIVLALLVTLNLQAR